MGSYVELCLKAELQPELIMYIQLAMNEESYYPQKDSALNGLAKIKWRVEHKKTGINTTGQRKGRT